MMMTTCVSCKIYTNRTSCQTQAGIGHSAPTHRGGHVTDQSLPIGDGGPFQQVDSSVVDQCACISVCMYLSVQVSHCACS